MFDVISVLVIMWLLFAGAYQSVTWLMLSSSKNKIEFALVDPDTGRRRLVWVKLKPWLTPAEVGSAVDQALRAKK